MHEPTYPTPQPSDLKVHSGPNILGSLISFAIMTSPAWIPLLLLRKRR